ncbi:MAG: methyltransferase domain-containing protein [Patescibacteria group bacterium]
MIGTKVLEERTSKYNNDIKVVKTFGMGTYIQVNGLTQSGGIVESIWKRTLKKIHSSYPVIHNSLILGLGGGTVAKLIHKYWPQAKIIGVEIDKNMVELGEKYLELDRSKMKIVIGDASKFKTNNYDLVIVDTYLGDKVVDITGSHLVNAGITIFNRLYFGGKRPEAVRFGKKLEKIFTRVEYFYPEANLMLICYNS